MDERYKKAKEIFLAVCNLDPAQRKAILDRDCAGDPELRAEVDSLLEHHLPAAATVPQPAGPEGCGSEAETGGPPLRIGPYRIIQEIGRGGMGVVYLAIREGDRFRRRVAVKLLKRGMDTAEILGRFERERQVLGALNHPGIARLYEAGETEDGLPYFAMEYIEGQPIDDYCDTHRLRIGERLELFRQVCSAIHYVHQNLMVHRDLKPSNILVTGDGVPKLLDFGIAKLINPEMSLVGGDPTSLERRIMTPEYASPEQVRGNPIGAASDIYSLGVILYELLTGHRPYHIKNRVQDEIKRVICDVDPERPSTAASRVEVIGDDEDETGLSTTITPELVAKVREGRPDRLRRRLAGDIDNMVLMAMRKEPQRRYRSADQFGEDIRRHLQGLPVVARRDTAGYRFAKFVRRHRGAVAAAAVFVVALTGWGVTAAYGWTGEIRHSAALTQERDRTRRMLDEVLELADVFIFEFHSKVKTLDGSLPALKLLAETAQECLDDVRADARDDPRLLRKLAAAYDQVGVIWGGHRGESFGKTGVALENHRTALAMRRSLLARNPDDPDLQYDLAISHLRIGDVLRFTGDVQGALESYREQLDIVEGLPWDNPRYRRRFAFALGTVGSTLKDLGRLEEARDHYDRSLDVRKGVLAEHPDDAQAMTDVGVGYVHAGEALALLGDKEGALEMYLESIKVRKALVEADPDNSRSRRYLALSHCFAADMVLKLDRPDEAAPHVEAAIPIFEQRAEDNPTSARPRQDLTLGLEVQGRLRAALGDHDGALESYVRWQALAIALGELNPSQTFHGGMLAESHVRIGDLRRETGDLPAAEWAYRQAHEIIQPLAKADSKDIDLQIQLGRILSALGGVLLEIEDLPEAQGRLAAARSIQESVLEISPKHARAIEGLVRTLSRLSRLATKSGSQQEALGYASDALRTGGRRDAAALRDMAAAQALNGDLEQAAATAREALDLLADATGPKAAALREALEQDLDKYVKK